MCMSQPKIKDPTEYAPAKTPDMPETNDGLSKGRRSTLLSAADNSQAAPTAKKTLLGQ